MLSAPGETLAEGGRPEFSKRGNPGGVETQAGKVRGADLWQEPQQSTHPLPMTASPWEQLGALSQFGSRKLHFALTQMGVGKSRELEPVSDQLLGLPHPHPSVC